jgi:hypothetical protein
MHNRRSIMSIHSDLVSRSHQAAVNRHYASFLAGHCQIAGDCNVYV